MNSCRNFMLYLMLHFGPFIMMAQNEDVNWIFSFHTQPPPGGIPGTNLHFGPEPVFKTDTFIVSSRGSCVNISDKNGEMLFFTNGINIYNKDESIMTNGNYINPGFINDSYANSGYPILQGMVFLPSPGDANRYHLIHVGIGDAGQFGATGMMFYYSVVRRNLPDSTFYVAEKNQVILSDTLGVGYITATKHGNGRDWWIIMPRIASNKYRIYLLDPNGIQLTNEQNIGFVTDARDWSGQSVFSPDGSKYIRYDQFNQLNIFDFDRCTGVLSNPLHIPHPFASPDSALAGGVSVSPNSRYLYLSATTWLYQYDLQATDIASSRILVGEYDGTLLPFPTTFYRAQLAPDGKIYITATNGNRSMHVIHHPDLPGLACDFENNAVKVDNPIFWGSMPYFPNYRLGALEGSGCDTLNSGTTPVANFEWQLVDTLQPLTVKFMDHSENPISWSWDFGDGFTSQDSCPVHTYTQAGIYEVCLQVSNNVGLDSICQEIQLGTSATTSPITMQELLVYPNPVVDMAHFLIPYKGLLDGTLIIYNGLQQPVFTEFHINSDLNISMNSFPPGVYYAVFFENGTRFRSKPFVIAR
jgi:hypothetical protein